MGRKLNGAMLAGAGVIAGGASMFFVGRETAPEAEQPTTNIEVIIGQYNDQCASAVLEAAKVKFVVVANDPSTKADEEYDSRQVAMDKSGDFIANEMKKCMEDNLPEGLTGYEIKMPVFTPESPVTTTTEG